MLDRSFDLHRVTYSPAIQVAAVLLYLDEHTDCVSSLSTSPGLDQYASHIYFTLYSSMDNEPLRSGRTRWASGEPRERTPQATADRLLVLVPAKPRLQAPPTTYHRLSQTINGERPIRLRTVDDHTSCHPSNLIRKDVLPGEGCLSGPQRDTNDVDEPNSSHGPFDTGFVLVALYPAIGQHPAASIAA